MFGARDGVVSELLHKCMTKVTTAEGKDIRRCFNWVVSRRAYLKVCDDALECSDWRITYDTIDEAVLFSTRTMFIPCYVLRVSAGGTLYQFGLNAGSFWKGDLPFAVHRERARLGYSYYSIGVRIVLVVLILTGCGVPSLNKGVQRQTGCARLLHHDSRIRDFRLQPFT